MLIDQGLEMKDELRRNFAMTFHESGYRVLERALGMAHQLVVRVSDRHFAIILLCFVFRRGC
jgi:hypothetical protein